mgnify:CR=1 FL=1
MNSLNNMIQGNSLEELYCSTQNFLFSKKPDDFKLEGYNDQGFPIFGSERECRSFEFIIIDFSNNDKKIN